MSQDQRPAFELPRKMEKILFSLATYYGQSKKPLLQELLKHSSYHIKEGQHYNDWDGGIYGHEMSFYVPAPIYFKIMDNLSKVAQELREGVNKISNTHGEYIHEVFIELQDGPGLENWRENSGALIYPSPSAMITSEEQLLKLWESCYLWLFLSHKAEYKIEATQFKDAMEYYGVSCFVAHEDIEPTKEWQDEIEKALFSMEALIALMTEDFSNSRWTDQEVGIAIGRQVPIIPIRLGIDPYGFIGKYQALPGSRKDSKTLAREVYELLWTKPVLKLRLTESLVTRFEKSRNYDHANILMKYLDKIENVPPIFIERLENAPKNNSQVKDAFEVNNKLPRLLKKLRGDSE